MNKPLRALVIDDEALIGMWLQAELERLGCEVVGIASTRAECMELLEGEGPDAVFMDICLPNGEDGIEIAREIRGRASPAIVFVTGYADEAIRKRAMEAAPLAFITKPATARDLKKVLDSIGGGGR